MRWINIKIVTFNCTSLLTRFFILLDIGVSCFFFLVFLSLPLQSFPSFILFCPPLLVLSIDLTLSLSRSPTSLHRVWWLILIGISLISSRLRWLMPWSRTTGCLRPWTAPQRCTSSCWTAGSKRGTYGPNSPRLLLHWINLSVTLPASRWSPTAHSPLGKSEYVMYSTRSIKGLFSE